MSLSLYFVFQVLPIYLPMLSVILYTVGHNTGIVHKK